MRLLLGTHPALGHVLPLLPLAIEARDAGHEVVVLGGASVREVVEAAGLRHVEAGPPDLQTAFARVPDRAGRSGRRLAALIWRQVFAGIIAPELAHATLDLAADWTPDLLVHDDSEQGTWIAAERLGIPHVSLQASAWRGAGVRLSAEPLGELRASLGLPPDPELRRWHRHGYLTTRPASLQNPDDPLPPSAVPLRPVAMDTTGSEAPAWLEDRAAGVPLVAVTLGTILPGRLETIAAILDGLAGLDVEVVATVGHGVDPAGVDDREPAVHVHRYIAMSRLAAAADALVFHAGSGTMLAALTAGVPLVLLPELADQPENADRCVAAGVGIRLRPQDRSPDAIADATRRVLGDPRYRRAAIGVSREIAGMPPPAAVLPALEALALAGPDGRLGA